jgi:hypothetical protein
MSLGAASKPLLVARCTLLKPERGRPALVMRVAAFQRWPRIVFLRGGQILREIPLLRFARRLQAW